MEDFKHQIPIQIRFNDIDIMGHVNNAVHQYYYDYARMDYFKSVFSKKIDWNEESLVLVNITIDYFSPIFLHDEIIVQTKIIKVGKKSITMLQECIDIQTKEVKSQNKAVLVCFSKRLNSSKELPNVWKEGISQFELKEEDSFSI